jgi:hypothetical protein
MEKVGGPGRYQVVKAPKGFEVRFAKNTPSFKHITRYGGTYLSVEPFRGTDVPSVGIYDHSGSGIVSFQCNVDSTSLMREFEVIGKTKAKDACDIALKCPNGELVEVKEAEPLLIKAEGGRDVASISLQGGSWLGFVSLDNSGVTVNLKPKFYPDMDPFKWGQMIQRDRFFLQGLLMRLRWEEAHEYFEKGILGDTVMISELFEKKDWPLGDMSKVPIELTEFVSIPLQISRYGRILGTGETEVKGEEHYETYIVGMLGDIFGFKQMKIEKGMRMNGIPEFNAPLPPILDQLVNNAIPTPYNTAPSFFSNSGIN